MFPTSTTLVISARCRSLRTAGSTDKCCCSYLAAQPKRPRPKAIVAKAMRQRKSRRGGGWRRRVGFEAPSSCLWLPSQPLSKLQKIRILDRGEKGLYVTCHSIDRRRREEEYADDARRCPECETIVSVPFRAAETQRRGHSRASRANIRGQANEAAKYINTGKK